MCKYNTHNHTSVQKILEHIDVRTRANATFRHSDVKYVGKVEIEDSAAKQSEKCARADLQNEKLANIHANTHSCVCVCVCMLLWHYDLIYISIYMRVCQTNYVIKRRTSSREFVKYVQARVFLVRERVKKRHCEPCAYIPMKPMYICMCLNVLTNICIFA